MAFTCPNLDSSLYQNADGQLEVQFPVDSGFTILPGVGGGLALEDAERAPYWQTFVSQWENLTINSGTTTSRYMKVNKLVFYTVTIKFASNTVMGSAPTCDLPVPAALPFTGDSDVYRMPIGQAWYSDAGTTSYIGVVRLESSTTMRPIVFNASGTETSLNGLSATVPHTWATGDIVALSGWYKAL